MQLFAGTSGYSYKEWKGSFYPENLPASGMLRFYASRFRTVEINNTFYRMPNRATLAKWREEVSGGFAFALKAPQRITHVRRLKDAESEVAYFLETASELGSKLGPTLFQLPPFLRRDVERLDRFLSLLPRDRRFVFEFRHVSWMDREVYDRLRAFGVGLCLADVEGGDEDKGEAQGETGGTPKPSPGASEDPGAPSAPAIVSTAPFGYLRLRRPDYDDQALRAWARRIAAEAWTDAYVFFKHEDEGTGPRLAARFIELFER